MTELEDSKELPNTVGISRKGLDLLLDLLSPDENQAAEQFVLLRNKLVRFFLWKGAHDPQELADESLTRAARKLEEGAPVGAGEIAAYLRGIGRMVFLEAIRDEERERKRREKTPPILEPEDLSEREESLSRLDHCLEGIGQDGKHLIVQYYSADRDGKKKEIRKSLATELGISMTALRIRAHRLREKLAGCLAAGTLQPGK